MKLSDRITADRVTAERVRPGNVSSPADDALPPTTAATAPAPTGTPQRRTSDAPRSAGRSEEWTATKKRVHTHIVAELGPLLAKRAPDLDLASAVRERLDAALRREDVTVTSTQRRRFIAEVTADILGYGPLEPLLADHSITEVMVNGPHEVFVERDGRLTSVPSSFDDEAHLRQVIDRIVAAVGRRVDESSPVCDARLPDGSRVNVILPPLSLRGPVLTIRKFPEQPMLVEDLVQRGAASPQLAAFLSAAVAAKLNVLVSGGTGTGKTTVLNAVSQFIPVTERIVTIEDAAELQLNQPHVVPLEARPPNAEGHGEVSIRDLVRNALRMRPDRIVVGEVRGPEALDMLQAMNTGHEGSLTTVHANTPRDALARIETMVLMAGVDLTLRAVRDQIASAIDLIVHLDRFGDGRRAISAVAEVQGMEGEIILTQDLFTYRFTSGGRESSESAGQVVATGLRPAALQTITQAGVSLPTGTFATDVPIGTNRRRR